MEWPMMKRFNIMMYAWYWFTLSAFLWTFKGGYLTLFAWLGITHIFGALIIYWWGQE
jgi:hypothetical protein